MTRFHKLSPKVSASPQISAEDVAKAAESGFALIINNRPDGEEEGQPPSAEIAAAAKAHGVEYRFIPVTGGTMDHEHVEQTVEALEEAKGPVLAFCRSGTRSTFLWAMAQASLGESPQAIVEAAGKAGYDISPIHGALDELARRARG